LKDKIIIQVENSQFRIDKVIIELIGKFEGGLKCTVKNKPTQAKRGAMRKVAVIKHMIIAYFGHMSALFTGSKENAVA